MLPLSHEHLSLTELHPALEPYRVVLEQVVKPAWLLYAHKVDSIGRDKTQFDSCSPFVPAKEGWPYCQACGNPLHLVWQLNFAQFSGSGQFADHGLFQFFYCWECFPLDEAQELPNDVSVGWYPRLIPIRWLEKQQGVAFRWYPDFEESQILTVEQSECPNTAEIIGADGISPVAFLSVPDSGDVEDPLTDVEFCSEDDDDCDDYEIRQSVLPAEGCISQLGGYPLWVQSDYTPLCPVCRRRATFVGAVGSGDTGLLWGDSGYWYIFACKATDDCRGLAEPLMLSQSM